MVFQLLVSMYEIKDKSDQPAVMSSKIGVLSEKYHKLDPTLLRPSYCTKYKNTHNSINQIRVCWIYWCSNKTPPGYCRFKLSASSASNSRCFQFSLFIFQELQLFSPAFQLGHFLQLLWLHVLLISLLLLSFCQPNLHQIKQG